MALKTATKTVTAAGTAVALFSSPTRCSAYIIRAMEDNTNNVYVGDSTVSNTAPDMVPSEAIAWSGARGERQNLADIFVDSDTNSEGVDIWYVPA